MKHDDPRLTAFALGELPEPERAEVEAALAADPGLRAEVEAIRESAGVLRGGLASEAVPSLDAAHRGVLEEAIAGGLSPQGTVPGVRNVNSGDSPVAALRDSPGLGALAATLLVAIGFAVAGGTGGVEFGARPESRVHDMYIVDGELTELDTVLRGRLPLRSTNHEVYAIDIDKGARGRLSSVVVAGAGGGDTTLMVNQTAMVTDPGVAVPDTGGGTPTPPEANSPIFGKTEGNSDEYSSESFGTIVENAWIRPLGEAALSTFSIDVDTAAYSIVRRCLLEQGRLPPPGALRIEELVNYFPYAYAPPAGSDPFAVHVDAATCPWNPRHRLVRIALKGREVEEAVRPAANIVLLADVSGSMNQPNKLPLVKQSIAMLSERLTARDRVAMVVYAGSSGLVLPATPGDRRAKIRLAIENLSAGGSTNGGAGIELAYRVAAENFVPGGINRVVLATDGDFNVGVSEPSALVKLVEEKAKTGVFLTALGYGMDNLKDSTLEQLADRGNGNYGYIDTVREAEKVLVTEGMSTLHAIAKDVKIQVEFNPARVSAFRLLGYENRVLAAQDFNDDAKDAGEIGAGHTVTAFYEVVPAGEPVPGAAVDELRYQRIGGGTVVVSGVARYTESLTVKLRWKEPEGTTSTLREVPFSDDGRAFDAASEDFRFAASVAAFGMVLRDSAHKGDAGLPMVRDIAAGALGDDRGGWRAEFLTLVDRAAAIKR